MLWALVLTPLLTGCALLVAGRRADSRAAAVGTTAAAVTAALALLTATGKQATSVPVLSGISFGMRVDGLSGALIVLVAAALLAVLVFAAGEFGAGEARARFFGFMLVFAAAMLITVTATTLLALLMAWEVMGATSYALIGFWWRESGRARSGAVAFLTTRGADLGLYLAAGAAMAGGVGGLELELLPALPEGWRDVVAAGVVLAALGKSAQLPFSFWLSRAMDGPSPTSALLHSATMVAAGAYLLLRLEPLLSTVGWAARLVAWTGAGTAVALGAVALVQRDLKQLLAASTCAQVGFMVLAAGAGGVAAGSAHLLTHAAAKSLLFLAAGAWLTALGTKRLDELRGVARRFPVVGTAFSVGALALAGLPPLSLWVTKDAVLSAALHDSTALYVVGLAASGLGAAYAGRALALVWLPARAEQAGRQHSGSTVAVRTWHRASLLALATAVILLGILVLPGPWSSFTSALGASEEPRSTWWELVLSAAVAVFAVASVSRLVLRGGEIPAPRALTGWLGLAYAARRGIVRPVLAAGHGLAILDDRIIDGGTRSAMGLGRAISRLADTRLEVAIDGAVRTLARGIRALGGWARRPQTGQLHHYYAQAVVALAVLVALLVVVG